MTDQPGKSVEAAETPAGASAAKGPTPASEKKRRTWGSVLLVVGAVFCYASILAVFTWIAGKAVGMRPKFDMIPALVFYLAVIAVCFWFGARLRPKWEAFLGTTLLILGGLVFVTRLNLSSVSGAAVMRKATLPTGAILVAAGIVIHLLGIAKRRKART